MRAALLGIPLAQQRASAGAPSAKAYPPVLCSVIKIILQFCKENSLSESFNAIQVRFGCWIGARQMRRAATLLPPAAAPLAVPRHAAPVRLCCFIVHLAHPIPHGAVE